MSSTTRNPLTMRTAKPSCTRRARSGLLRTSREPNTELRALLLDCHGLTGHQRAVGLAAVRWVGVAVGDGEHGRRVVTRESEFAQLLVGNSLAVQFGLGAVDDHLEHLVLLLAHLLGTCRHC